jgi:hypothetical protein
VYIETLSEQESRYIEDLEREARDNSKYITLRHWEHAILEIDIAKTEYKMDTFQGQEMYKKYWFTARQLDCTNDAFRIFKPNEKSGRKILEFLRINKANVVRIGRIGDEKRPVYEPSLVSDEDMKVVNDFH